MCLLVLAWKKHPEYPFVFAGNRDELHARPSTSADWWEDAPHIIGGRDLQAGGSWLGITRTGRFAVVTNYRDGLKAEPAVRSRGLLVADFLASDMPAHDYLRELATAKEQYSGFNLLFGDTHELFYFSNRGGDAGPLTPGIYGLSNHLLDTPWPKVIRVRDKLNAALSDEPRLDAMLEMLADREPAPDNQLPDTGVGIELERLLSPPCIVNARYGTRASTAIRVNKDGEAELVERNFNAAGETVSTEKFSFNVD